TSADVGEMQWSPSGDTLGLVFEDKPRSLYLLDRQAQRVGPIGPGPVVRFAGWDASGQYLALVVPDRLPPQISTEWAYLFSDDPEARNAVVVTNGPEDRQGRTVFSGMRVTFPQWSPTERELSLWVTFAPPCRSLLTMLLDWGLRPGDPAAVLDIA